ncbi:peptidase T [Sediminibacterium ginsengisoli]|uniref:Peptidase T n=1 Tax=Sediminibacterium ginsengisoli TaxID=413434 RepID=A0A1T4KPL9_9BACT|nr:peptidase T [Sediminibacterium ginsengisoli]SJZ44344.1 tripeptide aminopeptidase [Sediminibacterium ginsengisoli]
MNSTLSPVAERFMRYVQVDTQSDPQSSAHPSTEKQKHLSALLAGELNAMGIEAETDVYGYVYATIPSNSAKQVPVICFCSHVDTAPDCSGTHVKPILYPAYDGGDIILPDDPKQVIRPADYPYLLQHTGKPVITASGLTLLGADDKSGVAIIMQLAQYLVTHPEIIHGDIKILFTPDEEVGKGTAMLDMQKLGADFGYTLDGGELGTFEDETFSADGVEIRIQGVIAHPGYAKGKLVNAMKIAGKILAALPSEEWAPEVTEGRQGFVHPVRIEGAAEQAELEFIIRDFDTKMLAVHEERLKNIAAKVLAEYPNAGMTFTVTEQYRNMKEVLDNFPQVSAYAMEAYTRAGLTVTKEPIRGGTDGSRLSFMGLPCPNIFTGMQAIHSRHEWIGVHDMEKAVEVLTELVQVWEERS